MRQRPGAVIVDVADETKFAIRLQRTRHRSDGAVLYEAALPVPPLRPRIGVDQIDPRQRMRRRPCQQLSGVAREQPDITDVMGFDLRQYLRHAVDVRLAADEAGLRKRTRFRDQMLAAAESDFKPNHVNRRIEQLGTAALVRVADVERKPRQQMLDQIGLMGAKLVALAPAE